MNTKKIWLLAMVFGIMAAGMMFMIIKGSLNPPIEEENMAVTDDVEEETLPVEDEVQEKMSVEMAVAQGKRAITVAVTDVQGVAGHIRPGAYVDVVAVMVKDVPEDEAQKDVATLLLQNVKVLSIGHAADEVIARERYQMITLEVTPQEGLELSTQNHLQLMLRQEGDDKLVPEQTIIDDAQ